MEFVSQLKSSVDIVGIVGEYVRLRKAGAHRYVGLCPFHNEKSPSFGVHPTEQYYKCFGCGVGGDVLKFLQEIEGITFFEALKLLSERSGIPLPKRSEYVDPETKLKAAIMRLHEVAAETFRERLRSDAGRDARAYLAKRGVKEESIDEFGLGFSERSGQLLLRRFEQEGVEPDLMETSGLISKNESGRRYDRFRGRLMFPIHNESGKIIAFAGRALYEGDEPKYLNSPETPCYKKSTVLYNLNRAKDAIRRTERSILVEGYMDVIGVHSAGVREVVASCGTALGTAQVRALKRHAERIAVNFDPDAAGANAAERSIQMLIDEGMQVRIVELEDSLDPDEYVKTHGAERYRSRADNATGYFYWLADRVRRRFPTQDAGDRIAAFKQLVPAIQRIGDNLERKTVAQEIAGYLGVDTAHVLEHFRKLPAGSKEVAGRAAGPGLPPAEKILLNCMLRSAEVRQELLGAFRNGGASESLATRGIWRALFAIEEAGGSFAYADVEARLDEKDRNLLAAAILADEIREEEGSLEQARACLQALGYTSMKTRQADLRARVKAAERAGNLQEALRLMTELNDIPQR